MQIREKCTWVHNEKSLQICVYFEFCVPVLSVWCCRSPRHKTDIKFCRRWCPPGMNSSETLYIVRPILNLSSFPCNSEADSPPRPGLPSPQGGRGRPQVPLKGPPREAQGGTWWKERGRSKDHVSSLRRGSQPLQQAPSRWGTAPASTRAAQLDAFAVNWEWWNLTPVFSVSPSDDPAVMEPNVQRSIGNLGARLLPSFYSLLFSIIPVLLALMLCWGSCPRQETILNAGHWEPWTLNRDFFFYI